MKAVAICLVAAATLAGCASSPSTRPSVGEFVMAGPTSAVSDQLSMRWQYGLMLSVDPKSITEVRFSCAPIPGTTFSAKGSDFKRLSNGALFVEGPVVVVSQESTPWLYEKSTTTAVCNAAITRPGQPDSIVTAPVNFSSSAKAATLAQFKIAHEFNAPRKK